MFSRDILMIRAIILPDLFYCYAYDGTNFLWGRGDARAKMKKCSEIFSHAGLPEVHKKGVPKIFACAGLFFVDEVLLKTVKNRFKH